MNERIVELVEAFVSASRMHFDATVEGDYRRANREDERIGDAFAKLRELGPDAREALLEVAINGSDAAAVMAAAHSLKYDQERSLAALKRPSKDRGVFGFKASQAIKRWKSGEWKLE